MLSVCIFRVLYFSSKYLAVVFVGAEGVYKKVKVFYQFLLIYTVKLKGKVFSLVLKEHGDRAQKKKNTKNLMSRQTAPRFSQKRFHLVT